MKLVVDATAWSDLNDIGTWIGKDSPAAARQILRRILQTIEQLHRFPGLARPGRAQRTYERLVAGTPYIIVFELREHPAAMIITALVHGARNR